MFPRTWYICCICSLPSLMLSSLPICQALSFYCFLLSHIILCRSFPSSFLALVLLSPAASYIHVMPKRLARVIVKSYLLCTTQCILVINTANHLPVTGMEIFLNQILTDYLNYMRHLCKLTTNDRLSISYGTSYQKLSRLG